MNRNRPRIEPRFSTPADASPASSSAPPVRPQQATPARAKSRRSWVTIAFITLALIGGWHYLNAIELQRQLKVSLASVSDGLILPTHVVVDTTPFSNVVRVRLIVEGVSTEALLAPSLFGFENFRASLVNSRDAVEERLNRDLPIYPRETFDIYALLLPYRTQVTVEGDGTERIDGHRAAVDSRPTVLLEQWSDANSHCRDGRPGDWCTKREQISHKLESRGWCYGKNAEYGYQKNWAPCQG